MLADYLNLRIDSQTIFHYFTFNHDFLALFTEFTIRKIEEDGDYEMMFYSVLLPNRKGESAFDLAIDQSPLSIEHFLNMLVCLPDISTSR